MEPTFECKSGWYFNESRVNAFFSSTKNKKNTI